MADSLAGKDRLIFALDVPSRDEALALVDELDGVVSFFKVGLELLMSGGLEDLLRKLIQEKKVFVDLKLPGDITETVIRVVRLSSTLGVKFLTLSSTAEPMTIKAAVAGRGEAKDPKLLFVSYLSSLDGKDHVSLGGESEESFEPFVVARSRRMLEAGCDGLVVSGAMIRLLRKSFPSVVMVAPGIRPAGASADDHKRLATPSDAIEMGADYLVVGRPIRNATDRRRAAQDIIDEIDRALERRSRNHGSGSGGPTRSNWSLHEAAPAAIMKPEQ